MVDSFTRRKIQASPFKILTNATVESKVMGINVSTNILSESVTLILMYFVLIKSTHETYNPSQC